MRSATFPDTVAVVPGERGFISVAITNTSPVIDAYQVQVFGLDPSWIAVEPDRLSLFPGQTENVGIHVQLPEDYPASNRTLAVNVSSADDPEAFSLNQVELAVRPRTETSVRVDPVMVTGGRTARFGIVVSNEGNAAVTATPFAVDPEELGGAATHTGVSGVAHFTASDEDDLVEQVRYLLSFLPSNNLEQPPVDDDTDDPDRLCPELDTILPDSANLPYDMHKVVQAVVDNGEFFEYFPHWAKSIICGFARVDGHPVGVVGNQPQVLAGVLDIESAEKAARFVRTCDAFNIPLLTFVDVPGFLPGVDQEYGGIIRHGAKVLYAYSEATVPRISIITRKAYGGAYVVMDSKSIGSDLSFAWPSAELAVMGPQGAVNVIFRRELDAADDPEGLRDTLAADYRQRFANPYIAATRGYLDGVIRPRETRPQLIRALGMLRNKRVQPRPPRKHGNISL